MRSSNWTPPALKQWFGKKDYTVVGLAGSSQRCTHCARTPAPLPILHGASGRGLWPDGRIMEYRDFPLRYCNNQWANITRSNSNIYYIWTLALILKAWHWKPPARPEFPVQRPCLLLARLGSQLGERRQVLGILGRSSYTGQTCGEVNTMVDICK